VADTVAAAMRFSSSNASRPFMLRRPAASSSRAACGRARAAPRHQGFLYVQE